MAGTLSAPNAIKDIYKKLVFFDIESPVAPYQFQFTDAATLDDIEITNASIIDGLGNEAYQGNLYGKTFESNFSLNSTGKVLTPRFIDLHSHSNFVINNGKFIGKTPGEIITSFNS